MNWERGFKRTWYFLLALVWISIGAFTLAFASAGEVGRVMTGLLLFSLFWLLLGGAILWVIRGFRKDR